jgi:hypothetical protein
LGHRRHGHYSREFLQNVVAKDFSTAATAWSPGSERFQPPAERRRWRIGFIKLRIRHKSTAEQALCVARAAGSPLMFS